jgi:ribulose-phosphate 3-epimerase
MGRAIKLEASVACANRINIQDDLRLLGEAGIDVLHVDIMDGHFVNNFCMDFSMMEAIRRVCAIPMDCHLMVEEPERYVDRVIEAGATYVSIHIEATRHVQHTLQHIRSAGAKAGIALNPGTAIQALAYLLDTIDVVVVMTVNPGFVGQTLVPATLQKIRDVREMLDESGHGDIDVQVDGNVSFQNIPLMVAAGATMLVGGTSSIFHKDYSIPQAVSEVRKILQETERAQCYSYIRTPLP